MNERKKYLIGFFAICLALAISLQITVLLLVFRHMNGARWAIPIEFVVAFALLFWWIRRFQGRFKLNQTQLTKAARSARNLGLLYIVAPVLAYLTRGSELMALPHGLGFVLPIIPLSLAVHYLRLSARLQQQSNKSETRSA
jgi:hypothetical protein